MKKKRILIILTIILGLGISLGAVYYMYYSRINKENSLSTGLVSIEFKDKSGPFNLSSNVPVIDDIGLSGIPHTFTIKNTSSLPIDAKIKLDVKNTTTLQPSQYGAVRYGLYINDELVKKSYVDSMI